MNKQIKNQVYGKQENYKKSELLEQIRQDFKDMENGQNDIDPGFFNEEDVMSLYDFLLMSHSDDWKVIDDVEGDDFNCNEN